MFEKLGIVGRNSIIIHDFIWNYETPVVLKKKKEGGGKRGRKNPAWWTNLVHNPPTLTLI